MSSPMSPIHVRRILVPEPEHPAVPDVLYIRREDVVAVLEGFGAQIRESSASRSKLVDAPTACDQLATYFKALPADNVRHADDTHLPHRGDAVEAWIKSKRGEPYLNKEDPRWTVLDDLLDDYRLAADTGEVWSP